MAGHFIRRGGTYWFRRRVPKGLIARLGQAEIHRSLHTSSRSVASGRAMRAWLATEQVLNIMARNPALAAAQARLLLDQLLAEPLLDSPTADDLLENLIEGRRLLRAPAHEQVDAGSGHAARP